MSRLFDHLLISCPNDGGLFLAHEGNAFKLDNVYSVGLWATKTELLRGVQPDRLWLHGQQASTSTLTLQEIPDIHDVMEWQDHYYVVGTTKNQILKLDKQGHVVDTWNFPGEEDSMHLNCLGEWSGRIVFSAFGDFDTHRGYKGLTDGTGFIQDLATGQKIIKGLSQPHSLVAHGETLLVANSQCEELREYLPSGECKRKKILDGYTRGICIVGNVIYVGLSRSRNLAAGSLQSAHVLALDIDTWQELGRIALDASEVYSIVHIADTSTLIRLMATSISFSSNERSAQHHALKVSTDALLSEANRVNEAMQLDHLSTTHNLNLQVEIAQQQTLDKHANVLELEQRALAAAMLAEDAEQRALAAKTSLDQMTQHAQTAQTRAEQLEQRALAAEDRSEQLQQRIQHTESSLEQLQQRTANAQESTDEHERRAALADAELASCQRELAEVYASSSWRITEPLRRTLTRVRQITHQGASSSIATRGKKLLRASRYAVNHYGSLHIATAKTLSLYRKHGLTGIRQRAAALLMRNGEGPQVNFSEIGTDFYASGADALAYNPLVTIIVPNYNHASYLRARLDSIYSQTYTHYEVILLDDLSKDESREILQEYADKHPENTRCAFNEINSGGVFNQWKKGLELANGDLIWIAESDDYCSDNFIEEQVRSFANQAVMLSFARSVFVTGDSCRQVWSTEEYLAAHDQEMWLKPFTRSAHWLVNKCWSLVNIVPNVSSAIFRNPRELAVLNDPAWTSMKVCGDWVFYLNMIRGGLVAYTPSTTNYYRQHANNTSVQSQSTDLYYREHEYVASQLASLYRLNDGLLSSLKVDLQRQWAFCRPDTDVAHLDTLFDLERIEPHSARRKPNLMMLVYALAAGGGETFPIMLANLLRVNGYAVTLLNCKEQPTEPGVRKMLQRNVPLLELTQLEYAPLAMKELGIELMHSHHAWVDITFASLLLGNDDVRHVVSMHGMYEMMPKAHFKSVLPVMERRFDCVVYTAEKNLTPFSAKFRELKGFTRIDNALPLMPIAPIGRAELGISDEAFVLCLVSRAISEKGWSEAVRAVQQAQAVSTRRIHLLLIGEGPEYDLLKHQALEGIHLLGFKQNIRDYFALADIGFLPSRFKGESYPLVLIDCLHAGTPVLASSVGEIHSMLVTDEGIAGALFDLVNWQIPVQTLADIIVELARDNSDHLASITSHVPAAAAKFDPNLLFRKYDMVYGEALRLTQRVDLKEATE